ncbi:MAG: hypothetical protein K2P81_10150 [Bacteriovoracaceae bacterium]|nr:hypothetical protein [Bacteriovoracaceae bacterium]
MNRTLIALMTMFFAGSWLANHWIIQTTTSLLKGSSIELILAVSSMAGLSFFLVVRFLGQKSKSSTSSWLMLPAWILLVGLKYFAPEFPLWPALVAMLFGEFVKWHAYSQVLQRFGPLFAGNVLSGAVLTYELGTITASFTAGHEGWIISSFEILALVALYIPILLKGQNEEPAPKSSTEVSAPPQGVLQWIIIVGVLAGFSKISADTGFKYSLKLQDYNFANAVSQFYLVSACFTIALGFVRRLRWMTPRMGCPKASLTGLACAQCLFAVALFSGNVYALIAAAALQRSFDKIFYQPTIQLLASGFSNGIQETMRRWHVTAFLAVGSILGLIAFSLHRFLENKAQIIFAMTGLHLIAAMGLIVTVGFLVQRIIAVLDEETKIAKLGGESRSMAMLALLSPRHFLIHALFWSKKSGGMQGLPPEILRGLTSEGGGEVVASFYVAYTDMSEIHQMAVVRLAIFLDRHADRAFMLEISLEQKTSCIKARRLAAMHLVKVMGKQYRPLLRRARGRKSPVGRVDKKVA